MEQDQPGTGNPDPGRLDLVRSLPKEVMETLTKEEVKAMLYDEVWPDSLKEKLKGFLE